MALIVIDHFGPGDHLDRVITWTGIAGTSWTVGQSAYFEIGRPCYRAGLEQYFAAVWNRNCSDRGDEIKPGNYQQWWKAQGWRF
ncbi:MAG: unnamed protein product [uncultured Paraburkholderia sp.]|nr:MAG: unnamed protein product [uncultured Paraburkholderia sp.]CAH2809544.1 MAG: unnamed protein product [uncultured Paraburkholderia sp.]CAH2945356.1 MAG: unnamed protein product [uncultured Paraburkholderia sp.]CAH2945469.1 MAG: unnamed protein product [uncultured Paraburkholderia sp.]